MDKEKKRFD